MPAKYVPPSRYTTKDRAALVGATVIACLVVAVGALLRMPSEYYIAVRIVACFVSVTLWATLPADSRAGLRIVLLVAAVLYNPFLPFHFSRATWLPLNLGTIALLLYALYAGLTHREADGHEV